MIIYEDIFDIPRHDALDKLMRKCKPSEVGCWDYMGSLDSYGYGRIAIGNKRPGAHKLSFLAHGGALEDGEVVMHSCDNPKCVNPDHLSSGTQKDNVRQSSLSGRLKNYGSAPEPKHRSRTSSGRVIVAYNDEEMHVFHRSDLVCMRGFRRGPAMRCARGARSTYRGYKWEYL